MAISVNATIQAVSNATKKIFEWMIQKKDHRNVDKLKVAVDAGEDYILVNEKFGEHRTLNEKDQRRLLDKARKKFFDNNQG